MPSTVRYWFPAKRYGWGWGFPITWEGWATFIGFLALIGIGLFFIIPHSPVFGFIAYVTLMSVLFAGICWWKGEPPRWRWGDE